MALLYDVPYPLPFRQYGNWKHSQWVDFVTRNPDQEMTTRETIPFNGSNKATLSYIGTKVNRLGYAKDRQWRDKWHLWREVKDDVYRMGFDCEDQALEKRARAVKEGYPIGAFFPIICFMNEWKTWHCVLGVNFDSGVMILDNVNPENDFGHNLHSWKASQHVMKFLLIENRTWGIVGARNG